MPRLLFRAPWFLMIGLLVASHSDAEIPPPAARARDGDLQGDPLPDRAVARLGRTRFRQTGAVRALALSPDGQMIATACEDSYVRLWAAGTGKEFRRFAIPHEEGSDPANWVAFSPDGQKLAAAGCSGLWLWNWSRDENPKLFSGPVLAKDWVDPRKSVSITTTRGAFSVNGKSLGCVDLYGTVRVWEISPKVEVLTVPREGDPPLFDGGRYALALNADGSSVAFPRYDRTVRVWDVAGRRELHRLEGHQGFIKALSFSPDGRFLASGSEDGTLRLWDAVTGREIWSRGGHKSGCDSIVFSSDGKTIISGGGAGRVRLWASPSGKLLRELQGRQSGICGLSLSTDQRYLIAGGEDAAIWRWDLTTWSELTSDFGHHARIRSVAFSPDGRRVVTASDDGTARLWEASTGRLLSCFEGHRKKVRGVAFAPDGATFTTAGDDGTLRTWRAEPGGKQTLQIQADRKAVYRLSYCQNGRVLASSGKEGGIRFWDARIGKELLSILDGRGAFALAGFPIGSELAVLFSDAIVIVDSRDGKELHRFTDSRSPSTMAYSPDGRTIAILDSNDVVYICESASRQPVKHLLCHGLRIVSLAFLGCGGLLAGGTEEGKIVLWDLVTGRRLPDLNGDGGEVSGLASAPGGTLLASANANTTALLWQVPRLTRVARGYPSECTAGQCEALWEDLREADGLKAYKAIWALAAYPEVTVASLRAKLQPIPALDDKVLSRCLANLGDGRFAVRQQALEDLKGFSDLAVPALRGRLAHSPPLDERRSLEELIEAARTWPQDLLRTLRAIQVLEAIGTTEARAVLLRMANGAAGSRLTQEAKASLKRLEAAR